MRGALIAGLSALVLAGCASSAGGTSPEFPAACQAMSLAQAGSWSSASEKWSSVTGEALGAGDSAAQSVFSTLAGDTLAIEIDSEDGVSIVQDMATYQADLRSAAAYTRGCPG